MILRERHHPEYGGGSSLREQPATALPARPSDALSAACDGGSRARADRTRARRRRSRCPPACSRTSRRSRAESSSAHGRPSRRLRRCRPRLRRCRPRSPNSPRRRSSRSPRRERIVRRSRSGVGKAGAEWRSMVVRKSGFKPAGKEPDRLSARDKRGGRRDESRGLSSGLVRAGGGWRSTRSAQRVEHLADGVRIGDGRTDGEPAAAAHTNAKVVLEGSLEKCPPIQPGVGGVELTLENSDPVSERQDVRCDVLSGAGRGEGGGHDAGGGGSKATRPSPGSLGGGAFRGGAAVCSPPRSGDPSRTSASRSYRRARGPLNERHREIIK